MFASSCAATCRRWEEEDSQQQIGFTIGQHDNIWQLKAKIRSSFVIWHMGDGGVLAVLGVPVNLSSESEPVQLGSWGFFPCCGVKLSDARPRKSFYIAWDFQVEHGITTYFAFSPPFLRSQRLAMFDSVWGVPSCNLSWPIQRRFAYQRWGFSIAILDYQRVLVAGLCEYSVVNPFGIRVHDQSMDMSRYNYASMQEYLNQLERFFESKHEGNLFCNWLLARFCKCSEPLCRYSFPFPCAQETFPVGS